MKVLRLTCIIILCLLSFVHYSSGQVKPENVTKSDTIDNSDDLLKLVDSDTKKSREYVAATFKATRIINGHSVENLGKGTLDFRISHRFGQLRQGVQNFFGLDDATTKIGFDYGITDWVMVGVGRSTFEKEYDGFVKIKLLGQTQDNHLPVTVTYVGAMSVEDMPAPVEPVGKKFYFTNRLFYAHQILIARKFSNSFSLQLMPTLVHYNLVPTKDDPNNVLAAGIGGRIKLSRRIALTGEYYYTLPGNQLHGYHNALSFGIDIETGGHVFQLLFTNSTGISERTFIGETTDDWAKGGIHFGFNISRVFTIVRPKDFNNSRNSIY